MKHLLFSLVVMVFAVWTGCKTPENNTNKTDDSTKRTVDLNDSFTLSKTPCYGRCPVFDCTMRANGTASFKGDKNVRWVGTFEAKVPQDTVLAYLKAIKAMGFDTMKNEYVAPITDLPKIVITYKGKTVKGHRRELPRAFNDLVDRIDSTIAKTKWESTVKQ